ncbi:MAG: TonB-dependent receptor [Gammaproteobacteria bacterium]|nr:TonB-dependent receptor [Gammaproteobacteria bacterium]MBU1553864.1 TonB-dependent receptor [Gammaproteobacteria bacterium]MBU2069446.1 TonB-dependent receptor [Gammaproteobacteria bacterium]MBU2182950.1 TonB-dependent receptor [Gammaproteobacteria bacterium]MBU2203298.1 TonB-dependent receptor [Gammaproteobacteria bacterium]
MRIYYSTLSIAVLSALALTTPQIQAQDNTADKSVERIEVTGSRIKQTELEGRSPVQILDRDAIDRSGLSSIGDIIQNITASGSALNTKFNSSGNFGFPPDGGGVGAGATTVDLRHLGAKRVLVLVDGIRWVNESSASGVGGVVDLNTIPLAIVERIEVLEDGASSIYGSDAIAGVVNIITRRAATGATVSTSFGQFSEGDGDTTTLELSFGGESDKHSYFMAASYNEQKSVFANTREQSSIPVPGTGLAFGSSAIPGGRFIITDPNTGFTMDLVPNAGVASPDYDPTLGDSCERTDDFHCFTTADRFNYASYNLLQTPNKRISLYGQQRYEFSPDTHWYMRALYNQRNSVNQAAPEPMFIGTAVPSNFWLDNLTIAADNPYNPFGFDLVAAGADPTLQLAGRRPVEGGARRFEQNVDTFYLGTGIEGQFELAQQLFYWDINAAYSTNRAKQDNFGSYNARRIATALGPLAACQADPACVPLNIFGAGSITPAMFDYIRPVVRDTSENKLSLYSANISGELMELPAGALSFASGWEYRKYTGEYNPDALTVAGEYNGVVSLPTAGSLNVNELFIELNVPLLADLPLAKQLDLSLASRYSDYSTFGSETTSKLGFRWLMQDELLFRGSWSEGFRAPNIGELFGSASGFDAVLSDPCSQPDAALVANCAALGVPADYQQPNPQISVVTGGNRDLAPETSTSYNLGMVFSPEFAAATAWSERLDIGVSWYQHELKGAIQALDAQTQLNLCVQTLSDTFCNGIGRNQLGAIDQFNNVLTNIGSIDTSGLDFDIGWLLPQTGIGQFDVKLRATLVEDYKVLDANGQQQPKTVGIEANDSAIPEWSGNLALNWKHDAWQASWTMRYTSDLEESCGDAASFAICRNNPTAGQNRLGSTTYHDAQLSWSTDAVLSGMQLSFGVNNLFGKEPPVCLSCSLNGYDPSTYDMPGSRYWYLRASFNL